jgi:hypothetical protein
VQFWTRDEWKTYHTIAKDSSEVGNAQDNSAISTNKSMAYSISIRTMVHLSLLIQPHKFVTSLSQSGGGSTHEARLQELGVRRPKSSKTAIFMR